MLLFRKNNINAGSRNSQNESISSFVGQKAISLRSAPKNGDSNNTPQKKRYIKYSVYLFPMLLAILQFNQTRTTLKTARKIALFTLDVN